MYTSTDIAKSIKYMAKEKQISLEALFQAAGVGRNKIASLNSGSMPKADNLARIADQLGVSLDYLMGRTSNPIMNEINRHPNLRGQLDRAGSVVRALTQEAHRGYQNWHREIDNAMVQWLRNNPNATQLQFWQQMYNLYNTPDMISRFGQDALTFIRGMMM